MTVANKLITVRIEWGVMGYVHSTDTITASILPELIMKIRRRMGIIARQVSRADQRDGDLRAYTPQFANGYPSLSGLEPEWGTDITGSILSMKVGDRECVYRSRGQTVLRRELGLH